MHPIRGFASTALVCVCLALASAGCRHTSPQSDSGSESIEEHLNSGGPLMAEQALYDVRHVDLALSVYPDPQTIAGTATLEVQPLAPMAWLVLDLDTRLVVTSAQLWDATAAETKHPLPFEQRGGKLWIDLGTEIDRGRRVTVSIDYGGKPRVAKRAPWDGGFTWSKTQDDRPWIATSVQGEGADLWWPCKDHPSDKPESVTLRIRVPQPLVVASNGRLLETLDHEDGTRTYHWHTALPISNYNVALNIAPYETIEGEYRSLGGQTIPVTYWVLPENKEKGTKLFPEFLEHLNFYERLLGPYPSRAEKYGVAETPHLGMEHQSIIAYGNRYQGGPHEYDWLHHHELGHEWWGNLVTAADWSHAWIHEGICTYMQALYAEEREGIAAYHHAMYESKRRARHERAIVPNQPCGTAEIFENGGAIYFKGSWVIHMLRYLTGKETTLACLRRFLYPTEESEHRADATVFRFVTTDDFVRSARDVSGQDLDWFFKFYLRQPELPELEVRVEGDRLQLEWKTPEDFAFPMPVEIEVDGAIHRIAMPEGRAELPADPFARGKLDPNFWILKKSRLIEAAAAKTRDTERQPNPGGDESRDPSE